MIEKKTKCSEMALPVSFNLLIVEQHNTITKTVLMFLQNVWHSLQTLSFFQYSQRFLLSGNDLRQQSVQFWWLPQDRFPRLPTKLPRNFEEEMESRDFNSEKLYFLWKYCICFILCFTVVLWSVTIIFCDSWLPSGKTLEKRWSQVNQIFQTLTYDI